MRNQTGTEQVLKNKYMQQMQSFAFQEFRSIPYSTPTAKHKPLPCKCCHDWHKQDLLICERNML